ncbi:MAG: hypothetical protein JKX78_01025 [Alteromonadaceae bacterium]|nr:hypothetical protein [Alteromonadaceae bacterium]
MAKKSAVDKLLEEHQQLIHSENIKVISHVQRKDQHDDEWIINTIMLENIDVPFKYKRKKQYKSLTGQQVNITYYPDQESVAGFDIEIMKIVRLKIS